MRNDEYRSSFFQTSDLPLAVTLIALGFQLQSLDTNSPSRVIFSFPHEKNLQEAIDAFWQGKITIEPKSYWNTQRELKARIRNEVQSLYDR